ncbi:MAG: glutamine amidotransferase [Spirochaetes bacterium DG_61]|nr:MAG: glutamine amidotransferase [Spirochaetes bacterium DG_61]
MTKKILIVTGDGGEGYEAWYAYHRFKEEGYAPVVAAPSVRRLHLVLHDFEPGWDTYIERTGYGMQADVSIEQLVGKEFEALLIIGGRAPEYLRHNRKLIDLVREFNAHKKGIFSICHGIQVLISAGVVKGRKVTCYEPVRAEVEMGGGTFEPQQAVRDGNIITAQTWESHVEFYQEIFSFLKR